MYHNKHIGHQGEVLAAAYLQQHGYTILAKNWRYRFWEVDLIAAKAKLLHFVEVKTRTNTRFGYPEESITPAKMECMKKAAEQYQLLHPQWIYLQFDVLSINLSPQGEVVEYFFIEDVYF
ncbi:YraN family protein [Deminuibacter soli]|uniref:UPF0102 protein DXN05_07380 n=1 Tax=Deminuibacter soli TaxID=2291815 RepID=A0A3E1NKZ9_9BACT|nr:YraN family protein [Deminuibacter soli]RFM28610.1 YraN family protein [Deminuibacter soli]